MSGDRVVPVQNTKMLSRCHTSGWVLSLLIAGLTAHADFQGATHMTPFDEDIISYSKAKSTGRVAKLQERMDKGEIELLRDDQFDYLLSVLEKLRVKKSSQMLVFSKTSFQRERIDPQHPRALYFSDDVYVGFIPGSPLLEITEVDPKLGAVFYTLDTSQPRPRFARNDQCLECHASSKTMGVPGHVLRSFATDEKGVVDLNSGTSLVNHRTPIEERWGGWYVSGTHGDQTHRGNLIGKEDFRRHEREPNFRGNITSLDSFFDPKPYPVPSSDVVALMVLEHQTHMQNFITRLNYESTIALQQYGHVRYLKSATEAFVKYLFFVEEAPMKSSVQGVSNFAREFMAEGPRDKKGRSLRQLDLKTRLFQFPCSYVIYSDAFNSLPKAMKEKVYARMFEILSGKETSADYQKLLPETRRAILEILLETKADLPREWGQLQAGAVISR